MCVFSSLDLDSLFDVVTEIYPGSFIFQLPSFASENVIYSD